MFEHNRRFPANVNSPLPPLLTNFWPQKTGGEGKEEVVLAFSLADNVRLIISPPSPSLSKCQELGRVGGGGTAVSSASTLGNTRADCI